MNKFNDTNKFKLYSNYYKLIKIFLIILSINLTKQCYYSGKVEGSCQLTSSLDNLSFCKNYLPEYICVPYDSKIWNHSLKEMDQKIENKVVEHLSSLFIEELNNQSGIMPIINNERCWRSYITFICRSNFKACSKDKNKSYKVCTTYCNTFKYECGFSSEICQIEDEVQNVTNSAKILNKDEFASPLSDEEKKEIIQTLEYKGHDFTNEELDIIYNIEEININNPVNLLIEENFITCN